MDTIDYNEAREFQEKLLQSIVETKMTNRGLADEDQLKTSNHLLFCQHPHVYTIGKSGSESNLLLNAIQLQSIKAQYFKTNRGGDITYHGPGQIVGYLILDLDNFFTDIHRYLRTLEEAVILTLKDYGLKSGRITGLTGVWLDHEMDNPRKICAIGVRSSRWVTMHGFALNVETDLGYFDHIIPCGISDKAVTSLHKELDPSPKKKEVMQRLKTHLGELFEMKFVNPL